MIGGQLRHRPGRTAALLAGILAATTGFIVLVGSVATFGSEPVDLTSHVDRSLDRQVIRLHPTWMADRGLTRLGEVVSVRVRGVDTIAVIATVVFAATAVLVPALLTRRLPMPRLLAEE